MESKGGMNKSIIFMESPKRQSVVLIATMSTIMKKIFLGVKKKK